MCDRPAGGFSMNTTHRATGRAEAYMKGWRRPIRVRVLSDIWPTMRSQRASITTAAPSAQLTQWAGRPFQLVVVEEQGPQDLDLGAVGDGADAVGQLGSKADVLGRGRGEAHDTAADLGDQRIGRVQAARIDQARQGF